MKLLMILSSLLCFNAYALDEVDYIRELTEEEYKAPGLRLHKAKGKHQCQSAASIGHSCHNLGVNFNDCNQAFFLLQKDDCCKGSEYGGRSIGFKLVSCSSYF